MALLHPRAAGAALDAIAARAEPVARPARVRVDPEMVVSDCIEAVFQAAEALSSARARQHEPLDLDGADLYQLAGAITRVTAELAGLTDLVDRQTLTVARQRYSGWSGAAGVASSELVSDVREADATAMRLWSALATMADGRPYPPP